MTFGCDHPLRKEPLDPLGPQMRDPFLLLDDAVDHQKPLVVHNQAR